jgi:hypothetical protein
MVLIRLDPRAWGQNHATVAGLAFLTSRRAGGPEKEKSRVIRSAFEQANDARVLKRIYSPAPTQRESAAGVSRTGVAGRPCVED